MVVTEQLKQKVAVLASTDMTNQNIADTLEVSRSTVQRVLRDSEVKSIIEDCKKTLVEKAYQKSVENVVHAVENYQNKEEKDQNGKLDGQTYQLKEHGFKASVEILKSMGLLSSNAPSFVVNSLNVQNNTFISPLVSKAIDLALDNIACDVPKYELLDDVIESSAE